MLSNWSCVVITCPSLTSVIATEREINFLKKKKRLSDSLCVLTTEDPAKNVGSGAATLNALLVATEYLSVQENLMVISSDVLHKARILILHNGRNYLYSSSGKAFISLPIEWSPQNKDTSEPYAAGILTNLEAVLLLVDMLSKNCPYGVWVCSTDMMILQVQEVLNIQWESMADVVMFCIPSEVQYATGHGVVAIDKQGYVADICYCGTLSQMKSLVQGDGKVPLVSGIVFLKANVAESLLSLQVRAPLDSCTYLGLDSGADPIQVSLFFDLLVAMSSDMNKATFVSGKCGKTYNFKAGIHEGTKENLLARSLVWEELSKYKMSPKILFGSQHLYWPSQGTAANHRSNLFKISSSECVHSLYQGGKHSCSLFFKNLLLNSLVTANDCNLAPGVIICNSIIEADKVHIGKNSYISGIIFLERYSSLHIPDHIVVINADINSSSEYSLLLTFGANEHLTVPVSMEGGTFCNKPWENILKQLGVEEDDIWSADLSTNEKNLMNAKIYSSSLSLNEMITLFLSGDEGSIYFNEVLKKWKTGKHFSLSDVMEIIDFSKTFDSRRYVYAKIALEKVKNALYKNEALPLLPYFRAAYHENWHDLIMNELDEVLLSDVNMIVKTRTLSNMADLLGIMAGSTGGLRSGPGSNPAWSTAFALLLEGNVIDGMKALQKERLNWLGRPDHLIRAARHYERAAQVLIHVSVKTMEKHIVLKPSSRPDIGVFIKAECPARIDLQGGWTDTPPICYELGGSVVNIAVLIDGKKPIGAKACRIKEPYIILLMGCDEMRQEVKIKDMKDVLNYDQPNARGALLKAALLCAKVIDVHSDLTLSQQLLMNFEGGFLIHSWSQLPQGCGMGTSSILAGAIVSVLWSISGKAFEKTDVVHAVLLIEQLLTTGGGWQDQVSGIMGGINRGYSEAMLPLCVKVEPLTLPADVIEKLNSHFLLVYTGKVRLAKNLLQNVIRSWYASEESIVKCFKDLIVHSMQMKTALLKNDFSEMGALMDTYWEQKKILAPGCEPTTVKAMMKILRPFCYGQLLLGAGGGGFMCLLTKQPNAMESVKEMLHDFPASQKITVHTINIDFSGLEISSSL